jgi:hypothetical protein
MTVVNKEIIPNLIFKSLKLIKMTFSHLVHEALLLPELQTVTSE